MVEKCLLRNFIFGSRRKIGRLPGNEIDKDVHSLDREAYSLTAGFALGLILLEKGKKSLTIMDSTFTDELYHYMIGGHKEKFDGNSGYSSQMTSGGVGGGAGGSSSVYHSNGNNANGAGGGAAMNGGEHNFTNQTSGATNMNSNSNYRNNQSSYIREGESINTNVTCPGATIALGLIYFNSCDKLISEWFAPPDSAFLLDSIRPDFLLLRTVSRNLIMWKYVLPTQKWLINQLPNILKSILRNDKTLSKQKFVAADLLTAPQPTVATATTTTTNKATKQPMAVPAALPPRIKKQPPYQAEEEDSDESSSSTAEFNDSTDEDDNVVIKKDNNATSSSSKNKKNKKSVHFKQQHILADLIDLDDVDVDEDGDDFEADYVKTSYDENSNSNSNSTAESSSNQQQQPQMTTTTKSNNLIDDETKLEAFRHIIAGACMSIGLKFAGTFNKDAYETLLFWSKYFTNLNDSPARLSTENCLCVIVLSLAMVMAGSGDLETLRICRYLRSRVGPSINHVLYGSQMAINMAIALLFMGGGRYSLKTDSLSVALMICAFYPHFPVDSNDNRFHLQAFRHLYVLASESRLLLSRDVDTSEFCYVPIEITLKANEHHEIYSYEQMAPCILPELTRIQTLKVLGPRYYPIVFKDTLHFDDLRNILNSELVVKQKNGYFSYSDDPKDEKAYNIRNFLNKIIVPHKITPELLEQITNEEHINAFAKMLNKSNENKLNAKTNRLLKIIYESVVQETFDFVGIILLLDKEANMYPSSAFIQQIKLVECFYKSLSKSSSSSSHHIITKEFLDSTLNAIDCKLRAKLEKQNLMKSVKSYLNDEFSEEIFDLVHFCILNDINKHELLFFSNCQSLVELLRPPKNLSLRTDKLLKLYQLMKLNKFNQ